MELRKPMTETEKKLFKERVIREYKLKHEVQKKNNVLIDLKNRLKVLIPLNILIGIIALAVVWKYYGLGTIAYMFLFGIVWITLISSLLPLFIKER
ncbi:hypothetical protein ISS07_06060 [Candidatus Woesearchaeota archaeon]|nr:hypothetical protein [Candidatus Woesearchaeota archaeon]